MANIRIRRDLPHDELVSDLLEQLIESGVPIEAAAHLAEQMAANPIPPLIDHLNAMIADVQKITDSSRTALRLHRLMVISSLVMVTINLLYALVPLAHLLLYLFY